MECGKELGAPASSRATGVENFFKIDWRAGARHQGDRKAVALGAGFPRHHLIEASIAFSDKVR